MNENKEMSSSHPSSIPSSNLESLSTLSSSTVIENITPQQMAQIQSQIRRYKTLTKKYNDLKQSYNNSNSNSSIPLLSGSSGSNNSTYSNPQSQLTWQSYHIISSLGSNAGQEGMLGINVSDVGPYSKVNTRPLCLSIPQMLELREKCLRHSLLLESKNQEDNNISKDNNSTNNNLIFKLISLQRHLRANIVHQNISQIKSFLQPYPLPPPIKNNVLSGNSTTTPITETKLLPPDQFYRSKKHNKRDIKGMEKEMKKKKIEKDEARRRIHLAFTRNILIYREEFMRFHKGKRAECAKAARSVKQWIESVELRREKKDIRAESRRIQALKENNMEAYIALVQETKNTRLKYLLAQTDEYIATIRNMIRDQRQDGNSAVLAGIGQETSSSSSSSSSSQGDNKASQLSRQYYHDTHRHSEVVIQPRMLQGGDLKEYQLAGLEWLVSLYNNNLNGILADEMGLGKTIQTLALLTYVIEFKHNNGPFLIVVPLSTLSNWINEANKWAPTMIKVVYRGSPVVRRQLYKDEIEPGQFNTLFTTYEYIMKDRAQLRKIDWQYIIVDEGHRMKNAQSKFAQTLGSLYQSKHRLLLTGTPLQNNLPELWALLNFLLPSIFNSVDTFDQWFNQPFTSFRSSAAAASVDESSDGDLSQLTHEERLLIVNRLHEVLRPFMLRRIKDQVLDQLPDKTETVIRCEMSGWQKKLYRLIHQKTLATVKDAVGNVSNVYGSGLNNVIMQLRKVCNHPYLFLANWPVDDDLITAAGKFELLDRMLPKLKAAGHRVLMFSQMTHAMTILERFFDLKGFPYLRLDGSTTADEREKRMWMFNDPDSPFFIFLLSTRAGGLGLNLATADTVILFDSDWNPMMDAQAQDRAHRIGQKNEVRVFRLVTNSVMEEKILARATDKRNLTGLVVEAGKFNRTDSVDGGDRKAMMEALLKEYSEGIDFEDGESDEAAVPDDEQINDMMATNDAEFALYQKLDKEREEKRRQEYQKLYPDRNYEFITFVPQSKSRGKKSNRKSKDDEVDELNNSTNLNDNNNKIDNNDKIDSNDNRNNNDNNNDDIQENIEQEPTLPALPSRLMSVSDVPLWARSQEAWLSKHHQLFAMSEQVEKNNLQVGDDGIYTVEADGDDDDESNIDTVSNDGINNGGGRGMNNFSWGTNTSSTRKRKATTGVIYDDGLTEAQFMDLVEKNEKEAEDQKLSQRKKSIGRGKKSLSFGGVNIVNENNSGINNLYGVDNNDDNETISFHLSSTSSTIKINENNNHNNSNSNSNSTPISISKLLPTSNIPDDPNALTPEMIKLVLKVLTDLMKIKTEEGFRLYELFIDKPDKRIFPDYYLIIENPIAIKTIQATLKKGIQYRVLADIEKDFELICTNAKTYNEDSSPVYTLSVKLKEDYLTRLNSLINSSKTPKKKGTKKKSLDSQSKEDNENNNGDDIDEDIAPKKKRSRISNGGSEKKKSKKSKSILESITTESNNNNNNNNNFNENENEGEGEDNFEDDEDNDGEYGDDDDDDRVGIDVDVENRKEKSLSISLPSSLFKKSKDC